MAKKKRTDDLDRLRPLSAWARDVCQRVSQARDERRRHERSPLELVPLVTLFPLDPATLEPLSAHKVECFGKNQSPNGISLIGPADLKSEFFFAQRDANAAVLLLRRVRQRRISEDVVEYGFEILDSQPADAATVGRGSAKGRGRRTGRAAAGSKAAPGGNTTAKTKQTKRS